MSIGQEGTGLDATPWSAGRAQRAVDGGQRPLLAVGWIFLFVALAFYVWRVVVVGLDIREGFWVYWSQHRMAGDASNGMSWGDKTLRYSEMLARKSKAAESVDGEPPATIARPGPGLLDPPVNVHTFVQRWRRLRPVYQQILHGWEDIYGQYDGVEQDENLGLDYPPLRLLTITLWTWRTQSTYPGLNFYPTDPMPWPNAAVGHPTTLTEDHFMPPMLKFNTAIEGMGAIAAFFLVWTWERRRLRGTAAAVRSSAGWRSRWGNPLLLAPVVVLGIFLLVRPWVGWAGAAAVDPGEDPFNQVFSLDLTVASPAFWMSVVLHFVAVVALARFLPPPFRGPMCGMVAGTLAWLNPPMLVIGHGWPQWDVWVPPFFLVACALVSLDWWLCAGLMLGLGAMFKGQILFVAPVLVLCPLVAGWPSRFLRIVGGLACGMGLIVSPWLLDNRTAQSYVAGVFLAAAAVWILSTNRHAIFRRMREPGAGKAAAIVILLLALLPAAGLVLWVLKWMPTGPRIAAVVLCLAILGLPWVLPRRYMVGWLASVLAASLFLAGFGLQGRWSWWDVGFLYGTRKHQLMQMGRDSLSNLSSILEKEYGWGLHDRLMTLPVPFMDPITLDIRQGMAGLFFVTMLSCALAAGKHLRRNDPRFLVAITAPWVFFITLLPQLAARYTFYPAVVAVVLVGVSTTAATLQLLLSLLASIMIVNQILSSLPSIAPGTYAMTRPTHPGLGWGMLLVSAVFLYLAVTSSRRRQPARDIV